VTELSRKADTPVRSCALELLGKLGTPSARQHLLDVLAKDEWRGARIAAAIALGKLGGDDAVQALERAAAEDKIDTVRAAAKQALGALSKQSAPK
jgi:HEAT repeat protein